MCRLASLAIAAALTTAIAIRLIFLAPLVDPDVSLLPLRDPTAFPPPPPPPLPEADDSFAASGWHEPSWSSLTASQIYPLFAETSWSFPSHSAVGAFYWRSDARYRVLSLRGSPARLRLLGQRWAVRLSAACPSPQVAKRVRELVQNGDDIFVPVLLHRVFITGRPMWILLLAYAHPAYEPGGEYALHVNRLYMLMPWSGESLYEQFWIE
jgi:hypothetical protein